MRICAALERRGADLGMAGALRIFGEASTPGSKAEFTIALNGLLIAAAPGGAMSPEAQDTATPLEVRIRRSRTRARLYSRPARADGGCSAGYTHKGGNGLGLFRPRRRVHPDHRRLRTAVHRFSGLRRRARSTRASIWRSIPPSPAHCSAAAIRRPGLPSKAFDRDFEPLVEIVQDTVGRHDAFATACNSRYYDDMGYPGHVNCTDNFNAALAPYGIPGRKGWEALNYFYNTNIDHSNQLYLDEPWSRPGDYVLMRALTDLVCVSSSCPDDIDAANGWDPTDIHVRTYLKQRKILTSGSLSHDP